MKYLKRLIKIFKTIIIFFLLAGCVHAQSEPGTEEIIKYEKPDICGEIIFDPTVREVPITLEEVLSIVLDKNFDIKIFMARKNRDKWRYYQTITDWLPDITADFLLSRAQGTFIVGDIALFNVTETPIEVNFFLRQNISVRKYFALKEAFYTFNSARKELDFTMDEALLEASRRYYEMLQAKIDIEILKVNVKQIEEQFRINRQRVEAGVGTEFDVLRAEADRDNAIQRLLRRENAYRLAQAQLANTLGIPVFIQLVPAEKDILIREIFSDCLTLDRAREIAIGNRDDLAASRFDIKAARQRKNAGYSIYFPELTVTGELAEEGTAEVGVFPARRLTFFVEWRGLTSLGFKGYTEIQARRAELQEQQLLFITRTRNAEENIIRAFSDTITAKKLISTTFVELEAATESREISLIRLKEGIGTFIDVIQTQNVFTESRLDNLSAIIGYNISQIDLLFEMGAISPEHILYGFDSGIPKPNTNNAQIQEFNRKIIRELEKKKKQEYEKESPEAP